MASGVYEIPCEGEIKRWIYIYTLNTLDRLLRCIKLKTMFYLSSELLARELIITPTARCCGWWPGGFGWNRVQDGNTIAVSLVQSFCTRNRLSRNKPGLKAPALHATSFNPFKFDSVQFTLKAFAKKFADAKVLIDKVKHPVDHIGTVFPFPAKKRVSAYF